MYYAFRVHLEDSKAQIDAAHRSDDASVNHSVWLPEWHKEGILTDLWGALAEAGSIHELPIELTHRIYLAFKPQKCATSFLHTHFHAKDLVIAFLTDRMVHWFPGEDGTENS